MRNMKEEYEYEKNRENLCFGVRSFGQLNYESSLKNMTAEQTMSSGLSGRSTQ